MKGKKEMRIAAKKGELMEFKGKLQVLQRLSEFEFAVQIYVIRSGVNRNRWDYQNVDKCYQSFLGTPILCAYIGNQVGDGHNCRVDVDPVTGESTYSWMDGTAERIVGTISDDPNDLTIEEIDGETWVKAKGRIFAFYNSELVEKIVTAGVMDVSAETMVRESYMGEDDIEVFTDWVGLGVTILGDDVEPAVPNARIEMLAAMKEEFNSVKLRAAQYRANAETANESEPEPDEKECGEGEPECGNAEGEETTNTKNTKEVTQLNELNKKQIAELNTRFDKHTVLTAATDENGKIAVCLMSNDCGMATYVMDSMDDTIVPEKITEVNAKATFNFGEESVSVAVCDITDAATANLVTANAELEKANSELEKATETIKAMQTAEEKRRVNTAKTIAQTTLDNFNANRADKVDVKVLEAINTDIDNGLYTKLENAEGEWVGDKAVEEKVLSVCAKSVMEFDKENAQKNNSAFIWDIDEKKNTDDDGSIGALLNTVIH